MPFPTSEESGHKPSSALPPTAPVATVAVDGVVPKPVPQPPPPKKARKLPSECHH